VNCAVARLLIDRVEEPLTRKEVALLQDVMKLAER
jgi:hypothetical protein